MLRTTASSEPATAIFAAIAALSVAITFNSFSERTPLWLMCLLALVTVVTDSRFAASVPRPARQRIPYRATTAIVDVPPTPAVLTIDQSHAVG